MSTTPNETDTGLRLSSIRVAIWVGVRKMATLGHYSSWQTSPITSPNPVAILGRWREDSQIAFSIGGRHSTTGQRSFPPPHSERSPRRARSCSLGCDSLPKGHRRRRHRNHLRRLRSLKVRPILPLHMVAFWIWVCTAWEGEHGYLYRSMVPFAGSCERCPIPGRFPRLGPVQFICVSLPQRIVSLCI